LLGESVLRPQMRPDMMSPMMDINWTFLSLIGIFLCVIYLILFFFKFDETTRKNFQIVLDEIEKIKRKK